MLSVLVILFGSIFIVTFSVSFYSEFYFWTIEINRIRIYAILSPESTSQYLFILELRPEDYFSLRHIVAKHSA